MRTVPHPFSDFNQMLVMSVLLHCLAGIAALFITEKVWIPKVIRPAFHVELVEIPQGKPEPATAPAAATAPKVKPTPAEKPRSSPKAVKKESLAKPKPAAPVKKAAPAKKSPKVSRAKPAPVKKSVPVPVAKPAPPERRLLKELDQVAALAAKPKSAPGKKSPDQLLEQQIRDLESLKVKAPTVKAEKPLELSPPEPAEIPLAAAVPKEKELEFDKLLQSTAPAKREVSQPQASELLKELDAISELNQQQVPVPALSKTKPVPKPGTDATHQDIARLKQELASIQSESGKVEIETGKGPKADPQFKSRIHSLAAPDPTKTFVVASRPGAGDALSARAAVQSTKAGAPGADLLSRYVGMIERIVLSNWKSPVGAERNEVKAAFFVYPGGNINSPALVKSSGNDMLDNLALRAINDSEPFPPFPAELKEPNLHITIHFHYVFQDAQ